MFPGADSREFWQRARDRNKVKFATYTPSKDIHSQPVLNDTFDKTRKKTHDHVATNLQQ